MTAGFSPFGDRAVRFPVAPSVDRRALFFTLRALPGVLDVILTEDAGALVVTTPSALPAATSALASALAPASASALAPALAFAPAPAHHVVHVVYDGEDLARVAADAGLSTDAVIRLHAEGDYEVAMLGFLPGFAYLRGLDARLVLPRLDQPRARVPAGSVAIGAEYTGIYPFASPGGWRLLGRAVRHRAFGEEGAALALGDRVRFVPDEAAAAAPSRRVQPEPRRSIGRPALEIRRVAGPAIVIDGGRVGHMHEGVPHGGAMVRERLARANALARNEAGAAAIEIYGSLELVARGGSVELADDVRGRRVLADGEAMVIATEGRARVRYLAVRGGIDVPVVLGGRGTLLVAALGGHEGRALRRGDVVASAGADEKEDAGADEKEDADAVEKEDVEVEIVEGPDADEEVLGAIERATFTISATSDRIGTRLQGPPLAAHSMQSTRDRARSKPMVPGAIELTPSGLVVLGPDHPTTGGYPVVALVPGNALGRLLARPSGAPVRLRRTARSRG